MQWSGPDTWQVLQIYALDTTHLRPDTTNLGVKSGNFGTPARLLGQLSWARLGSLGKIQRNDQNYKFRDQKFGCSLAQLG